MIRGYIQDVSKMDVEIGKVLNRKPVVIPIGKTENFESLKVGFI